MAEIRAHARAEADGELDLHGLPIKKGQEAEIVVFTDIDGDAAILAILEHDPAWAWLHDPAEDVYSESDAS